MATGTDSNSSRVGGASYNADSSTQSHRQKRDIAWKYVSEGVNEQGRKIMICGFCNGKFPGGGINCMKKHLAGERGTVILCPKVDPDVKYVIQNSLQEIAQKAKEKRGDFGGENPFGLATHGFDGDEMREIPQAKEVSINEEDASASKGKRKAITDKDGDDEVSEDVNLEEFGWRVCGEPRVYSISDAENY